MGGVGFVWFEEEMVELHCTRDCCGLEFVCMYIKIPYGNEMIVCLRRLYALQAEPWMYA